MGVGIRVFANKPPQKNIGYRLCFRTKADYVTDNFTGAPTSAPLLYYREFEFYEFFSFLKFNEFYEFFFSVEKKFVKNS